MSKSIDVIAGTGLDQKARKSHWPARLDLVQSASGLFLGLFMWGHMAFVSTILISNDAMWWVTKMFEGQFILGKSYSGIVGAVVALVSILFVLHGLLAMRKFPANFQEYRSFASHRPAVVAQRYRVRVSAARTRKLGKRPRAHSVSSPSAFGS